MRTIFCYLAFRGCPNWWGYFNIIDISKSNYFLKMIAEKNFGKAEDFVFARQFVHDYAQNGAIPPAQCNTFSGYDSPEYMSHVSHAHLLYLQECYRDNGMLCFADDLEEKQPWKKEITLLPEKFNNFIVEWNKHFFGGTYGSGLANLVSLEPNLNAGLSEEIKNQLLALSDWGHHLGSDIMMTAAIWGKKFALGERRRVKLFQYALSLYAKQLQNLPRRSQSISLEVFVKYLGIALAYYQHLKRVQFKNLVLT